MSVNARLLATCLATALVTAGVAPAAAGGETASPPSGYRLERLARGATAAQALDLNVRGEVAGWAERETGRRAALWRGGTEIRLDTRTTPGTSSRAERITDAGDVLVNRDDPATAGTDDYAVWSRGRLVPVGPGHVQDINETGQVLINENDRSWVLDWRRGTRSALTPLGDGPILGLDLADDGTVSGIAVEIPPGCESYACAVQRTVLWRRGRPLVIAGPTEAGPRAGVAVTRTGAVLVAGNDRESRMGAAAWLWRAGRLVRLGLAHPPFGSIGPDRINKLDQVVGVALDEHVPVRWSAGRLTRLPLPPVEGALVEGGETHAINELGRVAGTVLASVPRPDGALQATPRPVVWTAAGTPQLLEGIGSALDINDRGQVLAHLYGDGTTASPSLPVLYTPAR